MSYRPTGNSRTEVRRNRYKVAVDAEEGRRRREDTMVEIRKNRREESLQKKRREGLQAQQMPAAIHSTAVEKKVNFGDLCFYDLVYVLERQTDRNCLDMNFQLEHLPSMVAGVWSDDSNLQLESTTQFRKLLSIERSPPIEEVIQAGVVPRFVEFLMREDFPQLQFEAAWALTNIASGTSENTKVVIDHGAVPIFVKLLGSPSDDVREQAVWALGNVAGDSPRCRDLVLGNGALQPLLTQLNEQAKLSMLRNATWTLSNFCRGKPQPPFDQVRPALPALTHLIHSNDEEVLTDACWALSYLSDGTNDKIQAVIEAGVCSRLVELLMHPSPSVLIPALRTVGNIVTGDDMQTQVIINHQALPCLLNLLTNNFKKSIKKEACWTISNITAGNKQQIQGVIEANIIGPLVHLLQNAEFDIKKEAAWAISNATSGGSHDQIKILVNQGCIKPLCDLLICPDPRIVTVCLEGLENILKVGEADKNMGNTGDVNQYAQMIEDAEGLEKIENLQSHDNTEIYEKAVKILETYWLEEEDETMPPGDTSQSGFNFSSEVPAVPSGASLYCIDAGVLAELSVKSSSMMGQQSGIISNSSLCIGSCMGTALVYRRLLHRLEFLQQLVLHMSWGKVEWHGFLAIPELYTVFLYCRVIIPSDLALIKSVESRFFVSYFGVGKFQLLFRETSSGENNKCCTDCKTTKTPLWRGGPAGPKTLCNACGIRYRKRRACSVGLNKAQDRNRERGQSTSVSDSDLNITGLDQEMKIGTMFFSLLQVPRCRIHSIANYYDETFHSLSKTYGNNSSVRLLGSRIYGQQGGHSKKWTRRPVTTKTEGTGNKLTTRSTKSRGIKHEISSATILTSAAVNVNKTQLVQSQDLQYCHIQQEIAQNQDYCDIQQEIAQNQDYCDIHKEIAQNQDYCDIQQEIAQNKDLSSLVTVIVFDIETTGFSRVDGRIIEIALRDLQGGENSTFQTLVNPQRSVPNSHIHGITTQMVNKPEVPRMKDLIPILLQYVQSRQKPGGYVLWVGHNARSFDVPFIIHEFNRCSIEIPRNWLFADTLPLTRELMKSGGTNLSSKSLAALSELYKIRVDGSAHRAMVDVNTLSRILPRLTFDLKLTLAGLVEKSFTVADVVNSKKKKKNSG
ncbi:importin subunit alpha-2-like [Senna tora]|uniref:Importin subunit alpha-2-like n=1 Tax=Senna tora TaxID=362788 RepID=A0A834W123_9FABA|nr:importin subunit alpha-2-like [Senna tora]